MKKYEKIIFYTSKTLLSALMLMSASMYFLDHQTVEETFSTLHYPTHLIYPLAIAKLLGVLAIWIPLLGRFKSWAYAGFFFNLVLALIAHLAIGDGEQVGAVLGLIFLILAHFYDTKQQKMTL